MFSPVKIVPVISAQCAGLMNQSSEIRSAGTDAPNTRVVLR